MRIILTSKDFKKPMTIEDEHDKRRAATPSEVLRLLGEIVEGNATLKEISITEKAITIKTKL